MQRKENNVFVYSNEYAKYILAQIHTHNDSVDNKSRVQFKRINRNEITSQTSEYLQMKIAEKSNTTLSNWGQCLLNISTSSSAAAAAEAVELFPL